MFRIIYWLRTQFFKITTSFSKIQLDIQNFDVESSEDLIVMALSALKRAGRGPFRKGQIDQKTERRDIAWLQRRGYHFDDILKAMQLENTSCA